MIEEFEERGYGEFVRDLAPLPSSVRQLARVDRNNEGSIFDLLQLLLNPPLAARYCLVRKRNDGTYSQIFHYTTCCTIRRLTKGNGQWEAMSHADVTKRNMKPCQHCQKIRVYGDLDDRRYHLFATCPNRVMDTERMKWRAYIRIPLAGHPMNICNHCLEKVLSYFVWDIISF